MFHVQPPGVADQKRPRPGTNAHLEQPFAPMAAGHRPRWSHLLLIHASDLGSAELGAYGGVHARTPDIDRLALSGVRFTEAHAAASGPIDGPDLAEVLGTNGYAVEAFEPPPRTDLDAEVASVVEFVGGHRTDPWLAYVRLRARPAATESLPSVLGYEAAVGAVDDAVGRLVNALRRTEQYRSTLVLLVGATHAERLVRDRDRPAPGTPQDQARVPMLLSWPGQVPPRQRHEQTVRTSDWMPTLLTLAQAEPAEQPFGGVDLTEHLLDGGDVPRSPAGTRAA